MTEKTDTARQARMGLVAKARPARLAALMDGVEAPASTGCARPRSAASWSGPDGRHRRAVQSGRDDRDPLCAAAGDGRGRAWLCAGRDKAHAERAALVDALMQTDRAEALQAQVLDPLAEVAVTEKATRAAKAAATKVDFFTMVRGED